MVGTDAGIAGVALADWGLEALTVLMWNVPGWSAHTGSTPMV